LINYSFSWHNFVSPLEIFLKITVILYLREIVFMPLDI